MSPSTTPLFSPSSTTNNPSTFTISPSHSSINSIPPSKSPSVKTNHNAKSPKPAINPDSSLSNPPTMIFSPSPSPNTNHFVPPSNPPANVFTPSPPSSLTPSPSLPSITPISSLPPSVSPISPSDPVEAPTMLLSPPVNPSTSHLTPSITPISSPVNPPTIHLTPPIEESIPLNPSPSPLPISLFAPSISPTLPSKPFNSSLGPSSPLLNRPSNTTSIPPVISPSPSPSPSPENSNNSSKPSGLQVGFYRSLCPNKNVDVEATITAKVQQHFENDSTLLAAILRMQFHDCFVHGCDASILIDGPSSEKNAGPNLSVRGYEFIDTLKEVAEAECPGVVSCADIIAIATKELIKLGGGPEYLVETGRRDGLISDAQDVILPSPFASVDQSISAFGVKKFTPEEMVVLLGCHTVGISHCAFFQDRLYKGTRQFDQKMDPNLRRQLIPTCPQGTITNNFTSLDQNPHSSNLFDNSFFDQILKQRGILPIDQALARDPTTRGFVLQFAQSAALFNAKLVDAMLKLQALDVLTGNQGEIRKVCSRFN